jgi:hypothetical protein
MRSPKVGERWSFLVNLDKKKLRDIKSIVTITNIEKDIISFSWEKSSISNKYQSRHLNYFLGNFEYIEEGEYKKITDEDMIRDIIE